MSRFVPALYVVCLDQILNSRFGSHRMSANAYASLGNRPFASPEPPISPPTCVPTQPAAVTQHASRPY